MSNIVTTCKNHGALTIEFCKKIKRYSKNKIWYGYRCNICVLASHRKRAKKFKELHENKTSYGYNYESYRNKSLKNKFNLTIDDYNHMLKNQNYVCKICKKPEKARANPNLKITKKLSVDHCHITKKIRGLLCYNCNMLLGHAKDSINILKSAIEYLKSNQ